MLKWTGDVLVSLKCMAIIIVLYDLCLAKASSSPSVPRGFLDPDHEFFSIWLKYHCPYMSYSTPI